VQFNLKGDFQMVVPGDLIDLAHDVELKQRQLRDLLAAFVAQHAEFQMGERVAEKTAISGVEGKLFRVKKITQRLQGSGINACVCIEYSGPVFKKDGGEHASHNAMRWQWLHLDGRDLPKAKEIA
jgi:hypothetical protein